MLIGIITSWAGVGFSLAISIVYFFLRLLYYPTILLLWLWLIFVLVGSAREFIESTSVDPPAQKRLLTILYNMYSGKVVDDVLESDAGARWGDLDGGTKAAASTKIFYWIAFLRSPVVLCIICIAIFRLLPALFSVLVWESWWKSLCEHTHPLLAWLKWYDGGPTPLGSSVRSKSPVVKVPMALRWEGYLLLGTLCGFLALSLFDRKWKFSSALRTAHSKKSLRKKGVASISITTTSEGVTLEHPLTAPATDPFVAPFPQSEVLNKVDSTLPHYREAQQPVNQPPPASVAPSSFITPIASLQSLPNISEDFLSGQRSGTATKPTESQKPHGPASIPGAAAELSPASLTFSCISLQEGSVGGGENRARAAAARAAVRSERRSILLANVARRVNLSLEEVGSLTPLSKLRN